MLITNAKVRSNLSLCRISSIHLHIFLLQKTNHQQQHNHSLKHTSVSSRIKKAMTGRRRRKPDPPEEDEETITFKKGPDLEEADQDEETRNFRKAQYAIETCRGWILLLFLVLFLFGGLILFYAMILKLVSIDFQSIIMIVQLIIQAFVSFHSID
ncbi:hypothetical protein DH86_00000974 [Scytalidium sp. 3C]|nr:hypothetical protein DH86_00000974 [Scytalidium sp. 3C]